MLPDFLANSYRRYKEDTNSSQPGCPKLLKLVLEISY